MTAPFGTANAGVAGVGGVGAAVTVATVVDELSRCGVSEAVLCPGKRSTLGALAFDRHPGIATHVVLDERAAGFVALGKALATNKPVVVWTTSGTAVAELHPAVVEASASGVPLVVISADRPAAQHHVRDWQTLNVSHVFGDSVRWSWSFVGDEPIRSVVSRAVLVASGALDESPGPVHLNLPIAEPIDLSPVDALPGREGTYPWHRVERDSPVVQISPVVREGDDLWEGHELPEKTLVVAGAEAPPALLSSAAACEVPVIADIRSPVRVRHAAVIALGARACDGLPPELIPELVITTGRPPVSLVVQRLIRSAERVWHVGSPVVWEGAADVVETFHLDDDWWLLPHFRGNNHQSSLRRAWFRAWRERDDEARRRVSAICGGPDAVWSEPTIAHRTFRGLLTGSRLVCGTSSPIRDLDACALPRDDIEVFANRGVSGLDGVLATATGIATAGVPTVLLLGDLGFVYDAMALVTTTNDRGELPLTIVVVDNQGGGIFRSFGFEDAVGDTAFERLVATPQHIDLCSLAKGMGLSVQSVDSVESFDAALREGQALGTCNVVVARVDSADSRLVRERLGAWVSNRVRGAKMQICVTQGATDCCRTECEATRLP